MALTAALKNVGLDAMAAEITHVGLANSGSELNGGDYARQAVSWGSASNGSVSIAGAETFDVPGGSTVNQVLLRDASTAGTDYGNASVTEEVFNGDGTYSLNNLTLSLTDPT